MCQCLATNCVSVPRNNSVGFPLCLEIKLTLNKPLCCLHHARGHDSIYARNNTDIRVDMKEAK